MSSLAFVMPAHGRHRITVVAMKSLARTIDRLRGVELDAAAFVVTDEPELLTWAHELGFGTVEQENAPLGRKFNDGYQAATDPDVIGEPFDYVVPIGSDDWIDPEILIALLEADAFPDEDEIVCFTRATFVDERGEFATVIRVPYQGGLGIRVIPRELLEAAGYRPVAEDRMRAIDASTLLELGDARRAFDLPPPRLRYVDFHPAQIIDWKSGETQLNPFRSALQYAEGTAFPLDAVAEAIGMIYGADLVAAMRAQYADLVT